MADIDVTIRVIEVVRITKKGEHQGFKVYITDTLHTTKFPRKPGDLKGSDPETDPLDFYRKETDVEAVTQALIDYLVWKGQGYKRIDANG